MKSASVDTGAAIPGSPGQPGPEIITVTREGKVNTVTAHPIKGAQPGDTMVVTVEGQKETITIGAGTPQITGHSADGNPSSGLPEPPNGQSPGAVEQPPTGSGSDLPTAPIPKLCIIVGQPGTDGGPCKPMATMMFAGSQGKPLAGIFIPSDDINNALNREPKLLEKRESQVLQVDGGHPAASNDPSIVTIGGEYRDVPPAPSRLGYGKYSDGSGYSMAGLNRDRESISKDSTEPLMGSIQSGSSSIASSNEEESNSASSISSSTYSEYAHIDATKQVTGGPFDSQIKSSVVETASAKNHGTKPSSSMKLLSLVILTVAAVML